MCLLVIKRGSWFFFGRNDIACVASVSVWFRSKERPRNGFTVLAAREMKQEPKKWKWGDGEGKEGFLPFFPPPSLPALLLEPLFARPLTLVPRSLLLKRTETPTTQARNDTACKRPMWRQRIQHYPLWRPFTMTDDVFCVWTEILLQTKKRNTRLRRHLTYERYSFYIYHLKRYYSWRRLLLLVGLNWVSSPPSQGYKMWPKFFLVLPSNCVLTYNHVSRAFYIILFPLVLSVSKCNQRLLKQHSQLAKCSKN